MTYGTKYLPIYGSEYIFAFAEKDERENLVKVLQRFFKDKHFDWMAELPEKGGKAIHDHALHKIAIIIIGSIEEMGGVTTMALVAHECLHAAHMTFVGMNARWGLECIETQCYLLQWLVSQTLLVYEDHPDRQKPVEEASGTSDAPEALQGMDAKKESYS